MGNDGLINLRDVEKTYRTQTDTIKAVEHLNLSVREGEFVSVIGQSGCGKTTTLNLVAGFEKPTSGTVEFDGKPVLGPSPQRIVVFQDYALFPWLTVAKNVAFGLECLHVPRENIVQRVSAKLELVGLDEFRDAYPYELSGGMKQRTSLARALATEPRVLLMDEPFGALDAITRHTLMVELERILVGDRKTIFFVTHSVIDAVHISDRILVMSKKPGRIVADIPVDIKHPRLDVDDEFIEVRKKVLSALGGDERMRTD